MIQRAARPGHIQILVPEGDRFPEGTSQAAGLAECWVEMGHRVTITRGIDALVDSDVVLPHVDLTYTPPEWQRVLDRLPNVVNAGYYDISKRRVSEHVLAPGDAWDGPVIIKSDLNYAGEPERLHWHRTEGLGRRVARRLELRFRPRAERELLREIRRGHYRVVDRIEQVPDWVYEEEELVVERFLPEREGDLYYVRYWIFIGDRYRCMRIGGTEPIVKAWTASRVSKEDGFPVPDEVRAYRAKHRLDFAKIDFVLHDGRPVILDVNRTPGGPRPDRVRLRCGPLAPGIEPILDRCDPPVWEREGIPVDAVPGRS